MPRDALIFGIHAVLSAMRDDPSNILEVWVDRHRHDGRMRSLVDKANRSGLKVYLVDTKTLQRQVGLERHQGVVARYRSYRSLTEDDLAGILTTAGQQPLLLVLDGITDPRNLGACMRTAEAVGVNAVIAPSDRAARITPSVRKVASGAAQRVPYVTVKNLARCLRYLKIEGIWLLGADDGAANCLFDLDLARPLALILGEEGRGLRSLTRELCDYLAFLPMVGQVESLNVSVATGICLYEALRQRRMTV